MVIIVKIDAGKQYHKRDDEINVSAGSHNPVQTCVAVAFAHCLVVAASIALEEYIAMQCF